MDVARGLSDISCMVSLQNGWQFPKAYCWATKALTEVKPGVIYLSKYTCFNFHRIFQGYISTLALYKAYKTCYKLINLL